MLMPTPQVQAAAAADPSAYWVYFGTYTGGKSRGIYVSRMDPATGKLSEAKLAAETPNPTFLALDPSKRFLYAANEVGDFDARKTGGVTGYKIDPATGTLTLINRVSSEGAGPCHLVVDSSARNVLVANYTGGSVAVLPITGEGVLRPASCFIQHQGSSVNKQRQEAPHAHGIAIDARNHVALVADLGLDKVLAYGFEPQVGRLNVWAPPFASVAPGAGPRHLTFDPQGKFLFVINEMGSTITSFKYNIKEGHLRELQTISTLPEGFTGSSSTAEIEFHPSGRFLYGSNRGHDSIAVFSHADGKLRLVQHVPTGGKTPRNFAIDPTGQWIVAGNQTSDLVTVFKVDATSGKLTATGQELAVGAPVCVVYRAVAP